MLLPPNQPSFAFAVGDNFIKKKRKKKKKGTEIIKKRYGSGLAGAGCWFEVTLSLFVSFGFWAEMVLVMEVYGGCSRINQLTVMSQLCKLAGTRLQYLTQMVDFVKLMT